MAIADRSLTGSSTEVADALAAAAERLRRATVQVRGQGPGGGSGVIWQPDGEIITNAHVAHGSRATVELWDRRIFEATVTARDRARDLAALRIEATGLPAATSGDSDALRVGELVLAVGNPLGIAGVLTSGIVHAIGHDDGPGRTGWVQADVRLAPGNSGGPLANARGDVIGINSMINGGLALAVPSNAVERFLRARGERPFLGVTTQPVLLPGGAQGAFGLLILEVAAGSPAEQAALLVGDVLVGANSRAFRAPDDFVAALYRSGTGGTLALDVVRGGRRITRTVVVGQSRPADEAEAEAA